MPWTVALALAASALLAGCGAGAGAEADPAPLTAVAGESMSAPTAKPVDVVRASASELRPPGPGDPLRTVSGKVRYGIPSGASLGAGASLNGALPFPRTDLWNRDVSQSPTDPASAALVADIGEDQPLRAGFGRSTGTPYVVVDGSQPTVAVRLATSKVPRAWPIPADAPTSSSGGRVIVVDRDAGLLYELLQAVRAADGSWDAASGTVRRLDTADAHPVDGMLDLAGADTGASAFPGLVRHDEADAGVIRHALRLSVPRLGGGWMPPAMRVPLGRDGPSVQQQAEKEQAVQVPAGLRLRLKASFEIPASASPKARAILQALKTYGAIVASEGPAWTLDGVPHADWDMDTLGAELAAVRGIDFEVVAIERLTPP
jgi:hypothetical protein